MAAQLAKIHTINAAESDLSFLPLQPELFTASLKQRPTQFDESLSEGLIRAVLQAAWPWAQQTPPTLLHGDFWPGNILWQAGQLQAVIDWEDALVGDPLADVGNARLELLWAFGPHSVQTFTEHYQSITGLNLATLPYWDLCAALQPASKLGTWGLEPAIEARMRTQHKAFVTQAFQVLGLGPK
jgi:aminoglycoside phosphotransferase (APT) family kinase protein